MSFATKRDAPIVVLGAGIIGLTSAVRILEAGSTAPVHIIADHFPTDPLDAKYASTIAGAHHLSFADDNDHRQRRWDQRTFAVMHEEWKKEGERTGLMAIKQTEYYVGEDKHLQIYEEHPDFVVNNVADMNLPFKADHSVSFTSLTMTPNIYLARLEERIHELGGRFHRYHLNSLRDISSPGVTSLLGQTPKAVIVCTGLGARSLGEVDDKKVFPTRGQVIKVRAPWVREGFTRQIGSLNGAEGGERTYVIPRPTGEVILGGTREINDWYPYPREETIHDIIRRSQSICPNLLPPHLTAGQGMNSKAEMDNLVVDHLVGFRPSREGGVRLEQGPVLDMGEGPVKVIYNYGHGGAGWQSCWGCAEDVAALVSDSPPKAKL